MKKYINLLTTLKTDKLFSYRCEAKQNRIIFFIASFVFLLTSLVLPKAGSLDNSFDVDGKVTTAISVGDSRGNDIAVQSDGKIVVVGDLNYSDFAIARYNEDGSLDNSFGTGGKTTISFGTNNDVVAKSVAIQPDGKIVVAGYAGNGINYDFAVVRLNGNGSLDAAFDSDGIATSAIGISNDEAYGVSVQDDGKILIAGSSIIDSHSEFAILRYNSDGSLDTSFDTDGKVTTSFGAGSSDGKSVTLQADGKILVSGSYLDGVYKFAVARYIESGESIKVDITIFLEGPYDKINDNMNATLTIPTTSPYTEDPETVNPIPNIVGNEVVDWVLVELRDESNSLTIIESQSAFVLKDGSIVDLDGVSPVNFTSPNGNYFISVKHRNHLSVMSSSAVGL